MKKISLKKKITGFLFLTILTAAIIVPLLANPKTASARWECNPQNVINCGVNDKTDLVNQITSGDGVHSDLKTIFSNIGILPADIQNQNTMGGVVTRDGRVILANGQVVATNVVMGFRQIPGLTGTPFDGLVWNSVPNLIGPNDPQESAYIYMFNGQFQYAVLLTCGNPVLRSLAPIPPHITITKEARNLTQNPNSTTFSKSVNANSGDIVRFRVKILNNSTITDENVKIGDILPNNLTLEANSGQTSIYQLVNAQWHLVTTNISDAEVSSKPIGALIPNQEAFLLFNAKVTGTLPAGCSTLINKGFTETSAISRIFDTANVNVCISTPPTPPTPAPTPTPVTLASTPTPSVSAATPTRLPTSGPVEAAGGVMGTGSLGYAAYLWRKSRKKLLNTLKNK